MTYNRPLEAFPILKMASDEERNAFEINKFGDALRWKKLDEDIHINSFLETKEPCKDNDVAEIFKQFPWLNITEVAKMMKIHLAVLLSYIYGMETPSEERMKQLKDVLHIMGRQLCYA